MSILDYFKPVSAWEADRVREFMERRNPDEYNLVDVRGANEYREKHLPGAKNIPADELQERLGELAPGKTTFTY